MLWRWCGRSGKPSLPSGSLPHTAFPQWQSQICALINSLHDTNLSPIVNEERNLEVLGVPQLGSGRSGLKWPLLHHPTYPCSTSCTHHILAANLECCQALAEDWFEGMRSGGFIHEGWADTAKKCELQGGCGSLCRQKPLGKSGNNQQEAGVQEAEDLRRPRAWGLEER